MSHFRSKSESPFSKSQTPAKYVRGSKTSSRSATTLTLSIKKKRNCIGQAGKPERRKQREEINQDTPACFAGTPRVMTTPPGNTSTRPTRIALYQLMANSEITAGAVTQLTWVTTRAAQNAELRCWRHFRGSTATHVLSSPNSLSISLTSTRLSSLRLISRWYLPVECSPVTGCFWSARAVQITVGRVFLER